MYLSKMLSEATNYCLTDIVENHLIGIAAVQKTKLSLLFKENVPNSIISRVDKAEDRDGGIAFALHLSIKDRTVKVLGTSPQNDGL